MVNILEHCGTKMNSAFASIFQTLDSLTNNAKKSVSKTDYDLFCKEFVFEKIKGKNFGVAFCEKFGLNDTFLRNLSDDTAKYHIEKLGYIKE